MVTERCVRRGSHTAVRALEKAMLTIWTGATTAWSHSSGLPMPIWFSAMVHRLS